MLIKCSNFLKIHCFNTTVIFIIFPSKAEVLGFIGYCRGIYGARDRTDISIIYCHLMTFQNKVDVAELFDTLSNYGKKYYKKDMFTANASTIV